MWIAPSDALYEITLRAYEKRLAKYWDDPNHEIFSWPAPKPAESALLPLQEASQAETLEAAHLPCKSWSQLLDSFHRVLSDGHLNGSMIWMALRYRLGLQCSVQTAATMARVDPKYVVKYTAKAKALRLDWPTIKEIHPDTLKQVMFPAKRPGPYIQPEFSDVERRIREDRSTIHAEWLRYACVNHAGKTYKMSRFYELYQGWLEEQSGQHEGLESV